MWFQYFVGYDIFGNTPNMQGTNRLNGPFKDKYVIGTYIAKLSLPVIGYLLYSYDNKKIYYFFVNILSLVTLLSIMFSGERMAFLIFSFGLFLIYFFLNKYKFLFINLLLILLIFIFSFFYSNQIKFKYYEFIYKLGFDKDLKIAQVLNLNQRNYSGLNLENSFFDEGHGAHFKVAYFIFLENPITGSGFKTFREECKKDKYDIVKIDKKLRCSTHPHNIYLESLSDTGIIGFLSLLIFIFYIFYRGFLSKQYKNQMVGFFVLLIVIFWPISSIGNFFNNWNAILNFLFIGIFLSYSYNYKN